MPGRAAYAFDLASFREQQPVAGWFAKHAGLIGLGAALYLSLREKPLLSFDAAAPVFLVALGLFYPWALWCYRQRRAVELTGARLVVRRGPGMPAKEVSLSKFSAIAWRGADNIGIRGKHDQVETISVAWLNPAARADLADRIEATLAGGRQLAPSSDGSHDEGSNENLHQRVRLRGPQVK